MRFEDLFKKYTPLIRNISARYSRSCKSLFDDYVSGLNECLWRCFVNYKSEGSAALDTYINKSLRVAAWRIAKRKYSKYYSIVDGIPDGDVDNEDDAPTFELVDSFNLEEQSLRKQIGTDQRQLIDSLVRSVKTDATTTTIVEAFLAAPPSASSNAIAKSLGLHNHTVTRKLTALGRRFDANRFGEVRDYLAV